MSEEISLYEQLGESQLRNIITEFYKRAFQDMIIGHLFFKHDRQLLTEKQIEFSKALLGAGSRYTGKDLRTAHRSLALRPAHFDRRQVIMREVLADFKVDPKLAAAWLKLEHSLRPLIVNAASIC